MMDLNTPRGLATKQGRLISKWFGCMPSDRFTRRRTKTAYIGRCDQ